MLVARIEETINSGTFVDAELRQIAGTGTPLTSAAVSSAWTLMPDSYNLTFSSVVAGVSATVTVACTNPNNPNDSDNLGGTHAVDLDGVTEYTDIIRGLTLVFSDSGSFTNSWTVTLKCGRAYGVQPGFGSDASRTGTGQRIRVKNTFPDVVSTVTARILPAVFPWFKTGTVFADGRRHAEGATEKITGQAIEPYAITVSGVTGSGASKTMDWRVDGSPVDVQMIDADGFDDGAEVTSDGLNVTNFYRVVSGGPIGFTFKLSEDAANGDSCNIFIFEPRFIQIATSTNNLPGAYGVADVLVAETLAFNAEADFWIRYLIPSGSIAESNPFVASPAIEALVAVALAWDA